jgi:hypothetical protein
MLELIWIRDRIAYFMYIANNMQGPYVDTSLTAEWATLLK